MVRMAAWSVLLLLATVRAQRPQYRDGGFQHRGGGEKEGSYDIYGSLPGYGGYDGYDTSNGNGRAYDRPYNRAYERGYGRNYDRTYDRGYRRSYDRGYNNGEVCPYENEETKYRRKREAKPENRTVTELEGGPSVLLKRLRRQLVGDTRYQADWDTNREPRYRDDRGYNRFRDTDYRNYRNNYREDRYRNDDYRADGYRDRERQYRYDDVRVQGGRDRCGREVCSWRAELRCDLNSLSGGRVSSRSGYVRWERENDAYYPRDKYRDVLDFLGSRGGVDDDLLVISRVRPEDKGVYRCYPEGGRPEDFIEVHFYPKFPLEDNGAC